MTAELPKSRFIRCRFARDGSMLLYVLINMGRGPSHLAVYEPGPAPGEPWQMLQHVGSCQLPRMPMGGGLVVQSHLVDRRVYQVLFQPLCWMHMCTCSSILWPPVSG